MRILILAFLTLSTAACSRAPAPPAAVRNVVLITIDTLRADHVGAYGYTQARTPALDRLAKDGARFDRAYATAPITLTSHASLMTGRYPPGHGARDNGMRIDLKTPTLAEALARGGFATGAFVAAFPLDRRFGLIKGFQTYGDAMPRDENGRLANERAGGLVVDEAIAWLQKHAHDRVFLWVHLFEPHAPYGHPDGRPALARYDDEVAEADRQAGRLLDALGEARARTLIVAAADHGEAFGEHGEISHSIFVYDTTLRVPLIVAGPGVPAGQVVSDPVSLVDVAPTIASRAGLGGAFDSDGVLLDLPPKADLPPKGGSYLKNSGDRLLYSESFAPLLDFGWSPLRTIRRGDWKFIAAPKPELYDLKHDPEETRNVAAAEPARAADLARQADAIATSVLAQGSPPDAATRARLQALGYASGRPQPPAADRPDPKDRRDLAARLGEVASGELQGAALERALRDILRLDPANPQANLRLGYALLNANRCAEAVTRFNAAIDAQLPSADPYLGRAACEIAANRPAAAEKTLQAAQSAEPDNPLVGANLGLLLSDTGRPAEGIPHLQRALSRDPDLHQARFGLAIAYARSGRRGDAEKEARELLRRLPSGAPQRAEVERLLTTVRQ